MTTWFEYIQEKAKILDENDPLKHLRERFNIPLARNTCDNSKIEDDRKCIYLNGNSLGCMVSRFCFASICQTTLMLVTEVGDEMYR